MEDDKRPIIVFIIIIFIILYIFYCMYTKGIATPDNKVLDISSLQEKDTVEFDVANSIEEYNKYNYTVTEYSSTPEQAKNVKYISNDLMFPIDAVNKDGDNVEVTLDNYSSYLEPQVYSNEDMDIYGYLVKNSNASLVPMVNNGTFLNNSEDTKKLVYTFELNNLDYYVTYYNINWFCNVGVDDLDNFDFRFGKSEDEASSDSLVGGRVYAYSTDNTFITIQDSNGEFCDIELNPMS